MIKVLSDFLHDVRADLRRPHPFAYERVGFLFGRTRQTTNGAVTIVTAYEPVADDRYVDDPNVGASIDSEAIRRALERGLRERCGIFHVHLHDSDFGRGFSLVDRRTYDELLPSCQAVARGQRHGALVLTPRSLAALAWSSADRRVASVPVTVVGYPMELVDRRDHDD